MARRRILVEMTTRRLRLTDLGRQSHVLAEAAWKGSQTTDQTDGDPWQWARAELVKLVEQVRPGNADAVLLYESPTAIVEFRSAPVKGKAAIEAARLSLRDSASMNPLVDPEAFLSLGRDPSGAGSKTHTLAATDSAQSAQTVYDVVESAGLHVEAMAPIAAATVRAAVEAALSDSGEELLATLRIDEENSALVVSSRGKLHLVRPIGLGVNRLIEALIQPIEHGDRCVTLDHESAQRLLTNVGIPARDRLVDEANGLTGVDVLPLLQPVLQRLVVELKQSLRFGLTKVEREQVRLSLEGPGDGIAGLVEVLSTETGIDLAPPAQPASGRRALGAHRAVVEMIRDLSVAPILIMQGRMHRRVKMGVTVGAGIAAALLALDAGRSGWSIHQLNKKIRALADVAEVASEAHDQQERAMTELTQERWTVSLIAQKAPMRVNWGACLSELSRRTPSQIQIRQISSQQDGLSPTATIEGVAVAPTTEQERGAITQMVDSLGACPLVESVQLGAVQRGTSGDVESQEFRIVVKLIASPAIPESIAEASP